MTLATIYYIVHFVLTKEQIRSLVEAKYLELMNGADPELALKAAKELATISGLYADVNPKSLNASQTNNFVLTPDQMSGVLEGLRSLTGKVEEVDSERTITG